MHTHTCHAIPILTMHTLNTYTQAFTQKQADKQTPLPVPLAVNHKFKANGNFFFCAFDVKTGKLQMPPPPPSRFLPF